jgi:hypothetical protein
MKIKFSVLLAAIAFTALLVPTFGRQAEAQKHPSYLHALSDLRLARAYIDRLTPSERLDDDQNAAIHEIEEALSQIKAASIDDGKNINEHMQIDAHIQPHSRFQKAREALAAAEHDVSQEEDDPHTQGLQSRIMDHIHKASQHVKRIQERLHIE